jgi:hypothetical protein
MALEIPDYKTVMQGELLSRGRWVVANVAGAVFWPVRVQKAPYRGHQVIVIPVSKDRHAAIALKLSDQMTTEEGERLLMQLLSTLSWIEGAGVSVEGFSGGDLPRALGLRQTHYAVRDEFDLSYFPEPKDERTLLALALFREGHSLNHTAYAFLSFYRVLETKFPNGADRRRWLDNNLERVRDIRARTVLQRLKAEHGDVGAHLWESGRCAIAHAKEGEIVNPDDPADARRLRDELPLMAELAALMIENEFGVETLQTVYRKHLYELAGFRQFLDPEIVDLVQKGTPIAEGKPIDIPTLRIELRGKEPYQPLSRMEPMSVWSEGQALIIKAQSVGKNINLQLRLDFNAERLLFDISNDIAARDNGTRQGALDIAECLRFVDDYYANGRLVIYDADSGALLSRKDAFLPVNVMPGTGGFSEEIEKWKTAASTRVI